MLVRAHAKVNLGLDVVARRSDGYHDIDTLFVRLELHDTLRLEARERGIVLEIEGADLPNNTSNLAYRAAQRYLEEAGRPEGVAIHLQKRIPIAAGLGGGSSDAAAVLRGLAELLPAEVNLVSLARDLGSDVPFFVQNVPAARGQGRGERLTPVALPRLQLVLINPGVEVSAKEAYEGLQTFGTGLELVHIIERLHVGEEPGYYNTLQEDVVAHKPMIDEVLAALRNAGLRGVLMSGSGATCFGLASSPAHAKRVAAGLEDVQPGWWVCTTNTL